MEKLHPNLPNISGDVYRTTVGQPLGAFYGYVMEGIYQNVAEIKSHLHGTLNPARQARRHQVQGSEWRRSHQRRRQDIHRQSDPEDCHTG